MSSSYPLSGSSSEALHSKAREIMRMSKSVSNYLLPDVSGLNDHGMEDKSVYYTGDIIRYSESLLSNIARAESEFFQESRRQYVHAVGILTDRLSKHCEYLELANSNGRDFVRLLRKEIQKFRKLQRVWRLTL
ncbi:hypothetical protein [Christiangramia portivictoriae]|uniref:hypothetical protein n=1 Tax=Christiangramia portivictoriae TaxID=326069 RepID=UPI00068803C2|nr:hypothetical protein [Christiangramia portivictoriae]